MACGTGIKNEKILLEQTYDGIRINCAFQIGERPKEEQKNRKLSRVHFDIALSDIKSPQYEKTQMPSLIEPESAIFWYVYPVEQIFAEKLETFVKRGAKNSRSKDIYDMVKIYHKCLDKNKLADNIEQTFLERNTNRPPSLREFANSIDQTILRASWVSLIMPDPGMSFDEAWNELISVFANLDSYLLLEL